MKVVVCVKQVPEPGEVKVNRETRTLIKDGVNMIINPFDSYAIEEGLRIKEKLGGTLTTISMGEPKAQEALRETVALGADQAVLLSDPSFVDSDTLATAYILAKGISKLDGYDLIILGKQAIDGQSAQVGPSLAEELGIPHLTQVRKIVDLKDGYAKVERLIEGGVETVETSLPALITVVKEINEPRLPSLKGIMKAKKAEIANWNAAALGVDPSRAGKAGSPTSVVEVNLPPARPKGEILGGDLNEQVKGLVQKIRETKIV